MRCFGLYREFTVTRAVSPNRRRPCKKGVDADSSSTRTRPTHNTYTQTCRLADLHALRRRTRIPILYKAVGTVVLIRICTNISVLFCWNEWRGNVFQLKFGRFLQRIPKCTQNYCTFTITVVYMDICICINIYISLHVGVPSGIL